MYHAFSRLQLRKLRDVSASIDELLKLTLRAFSSDQFHAWEDCSLALAMLGQFRDVLVLPSRQRLLKMLRETVRTSRSRAKEG